MLQKGGQRWGSQYEIFISMIKNHYPQSNEDLKTWFFAIQNFQDCQQNGNNGNNIAWQNTSDNEETNNLLFSKYYIWLGIPLLTLSW